MQILIIGGTRFVGRHVAERAAAGGHNVTLFNRGVSDPGAWPGEHIAGDREQGTAGLSGLAGRKFDATIDVSAYVPRRVRELLSVLGAGAGLYTLISSISVYPDDTPAGYDEGSPTRSPSDSEELRMEEYGELKVGCELAATEETGGAVCVVRPGYVVGPFDPTGRFTYWVERVARAAGGLMLGPAAEQPLQVIDGRDLAAFTVGLVETGTTGVFNATAPDPAVEFRDLLPQLADGLEVPAPEVRWSREHDLLPLTEAPEGWGMSRGDLSRGRAHGLAWRPLPEDLP